ncbi:MAG: type II secretion system minor pseudopilin GspH [Gammaproteobacteria bacterium]|nr:type II secretion system minor pseudopilin GspH [Gammaproteobacteria bacterium]
MQIRLPQKSCRQLRGFTLLELLVVVVIAAILFTYTTLAIRSDSPADIIKNEAQRFERLVQLALEEAILRGEEYAIEVHLNSYRFLRASEDQWRPVTDDKILRDRQLPLDMALEMQLEETEIVITPGDTAALEADQESDDNKKTKAEPQVYLLSSGEITPEFDVRFYILGVKISYDVKGHFDGSLTTKISDL